VAPKASTPRPARRALRPHLGGERHLCRSGATHEGALLTREKYCGPPSTPVSTTICPSRTNHPVQGPGCRGLARSPSCGPRSSQTCQRLPVTPLGSSGTSLRLLPVSHDESSLPARSAAAVRRVDRLRPQAALSDQPRDHRVGVPHLTGSQLVPTPKRASGGRAPSQAIGVHTLRHPSAAAGYRPPRRHPE
jgi:hypothetical protein